MSNKSPSIEILEKDLSAYTVTSSETVLAVVGFATKGPVGTPTVLTSRSDFEEQFGTTVTDSPYSALAVARAFNQGNKVIFDRVAADSGDDAAAPSTATVSNIEPSIAASEDLDVGAASLTGLNDGETYNITINIDGTAYEAVLDLSTDTASTTEATVAEIKSVIDVAIAGHATTSVETYVITVTTNLTGALGSLTLTAGTTGDNDLIADTSATVSGAVVGSDDGDNTDDIVFTTVEKGSSMDLLSIVKSSRTNPVTGSLIHKIEVLYDGVLKETFDEVSLTVADATYFKTVMEADTDNGGSKFFTTDSIAITDNDDATETEFQDLTYTFSGGKDGYLADATSLFVTELSTTGALANTEMFDYHILITPDMPEQDVQEAALELANFRKDFIYIVDPPQSLTYEQVITWHNGGGQGRTLVLNNSYAATYWSWLKEYNKVTKEYVWCPPSVFIAEKFMEVDRLYAPWFAPAGDLRGKITAADYESSPSFAQRELLYGDFNAVNPIVNFVSKGLEIYGQKTLLRENNSLNRINVRRMVIYAKKLIKKALESIVFEPHNPDSWRKATNLVTAILEPIRQNGGIDKYSVAIDDTTNTPDVIAQNIMKGTIKIIPMNTIEIIEITMQLHKAGASLDE